MLYTVNVLCKTVMQKNLYLRALTILIKTTCIIYSFELLGGRAIPLPVTMRQTYRVSISETLLEYTIWTRMLQWVEKPLSDSYLLYLGHKIRLVSYQPMTSYVRHTTSDIFENNKSVEFSKSNN
jgi:hypothetical protein